MNDLFIGGGGYSGFTFIGALEYIKTKNLLDLKNFYGTSIGSLIGILYISGMDPKIMVNKFLKLNLTDVIKYDIMNFGTRNCIIDDKLFETLIGFLWEYHPEEITIKEFYDKTNVNINIIVTNVTKNKCVLFNNTDYPEIKLKDAIKASMSIPFIFKPVEIDGDTYVDGCCKNIYGSPSQDIYICGYSLIVETPEENCTYPLKIIKNMVNRDKPRSTFLVTCQNLNSTDMYTNLDKLDSKFILEMYKSGITSAKKYLET